ncbi:MAG: toprim domain-containing protein [Xanthobacteraceae bacterium]
MPDRIADLARRLARDAEAVCRHYLPNGRRCGRYWIVGDLANTPGRSLYVRLHGPEHGARAAGHWTDACTQEHGDLLDLIRGACRLGTTREVLDEARRFLSLPRHDLPVQRQAPAPAGSPEAARRLFAMGRPIRGTLAETYLRHRGITNLQKTPALRFHPRCFYRANDGAPRETRPALLAAVTDFNGTITGVHRTWLARDGAGKAPIATPRRAMGCLLGNGVWFGTARDVLAAGEGIETVLSLRCALLRLPLVAALSANHLAALALPSGLRRLYIARDNDRAGFRAAETLTARAQANGIEAVTLTPAGDDFNADLRLFGHHGLIQSLRAQFAPEDVTRFLRC